jgi:hypothetical protein
MLVNQSVWITSHDHYAINGAVIVAVMLTLPVTSVITLIDILI